MPIPGLPCESGEGQEFKNSVRRQLKELHAKLPAFSRLLVPLKVTFLMVTPQQGKYLDNLAQRKDLDNLALKILPLVHEIFQPPLVPSIIADMLPSGDDSPENHATRKRLQFIRTHSVTAFEAIALKRHEEDSPQGHLRLALGSGSQTGSTWSRIANYAEKIMENTSD